jgi:ABC-type multidrug transport system ATPase subunit
MIQPDPLIKAYGGKTVVNGLTFTVRAGVVTRFLRTHGAGKSATIRAIVGVDRPTAWPASWHRRGAIPWAGFAVMRAHAVAASSPAVVPLRTQDT